MSENKSTRLNQAARELNIGIANIVEYLGKKGFSIDSNPNTRLDGDQYELLQKEFAQSAQTKKEASSLSIGKKFPENTNDRPRKAVESPAAIVVAPAAAVTVAAPSVAAVPAAASVAVSPTAPIVAAAAAAPSEVVAPPPAVAAAGPEANLSDPANAEPAKKSGLTVLGKIDLNEFSSKKSGSQSSSSSSGSGNRNAPRNQNNSDRSSSQGNNSANQGSDSQRNRRSQSQGTGQNQSPGSRSRPPAPSRPTDNTPAPTPQRPPVAQVQAPEPVVQVPIVAAPEPETINLRVETLKGLTVLGKIELPADKAKKGKPSLNSGGVLSEEEKRKRKRKRKRVNSGPGMGTGANNTNTNSSATGTTASSAGSMGGNNNRSYPPRPGQSRPSDNNNNNNSNNSNNYNSRPRPAGTSGPSSGPGSNNNTNNNNNAGNRNRPGAKPATRPGERVEVSDKEIQDQIKATLSRLSAGTRTSGMANRAKHRRDRRTDAAAANEERMFQEQQEAKVLKVTEFVSANDLASLMDVSVNEVIATCMSLGMFVSINQRLDAEAITVIADEFGFNVDFNSVEEEQQEELIIDSPESLVMRAPIVTIMGHVDHGKTSLLDYIRKTKVASGEAGGITQHIGAYNVTTDSGRQITFLDTPGHEAFTAMRARGAKVTDVVIIVVAADDNVMPQTEEAINHAKAANVPIVIAINKIDKAGANPEKVREELANRNVLVEDWGGKYQCEEISAKTGHGISNLLEKVLLEAELLDLKANPARQAGGTVIEVMLDKGRGYVSTVVVQNGTLKVGDVVLAGSHYGKVKAMNDYRGKKVKTAGPSIAVQILGLDGAPQAGDRFSVFELEREAREIANKREQLQREQSIRTKKHITIDEIGRRIALGTFKELNLIVKGDVDGSVEALSGSLLKLSSPEVEVRIIHKAVGQISESDIQLATASDAIVVGFQVRPSIGARKLAEQEEIQIKLYSIIYDAINEIKAAIEGMIAPKIEEIIVATVEIRQVFKISKVGNIAGCMVTDGTLHRKHKVRIIRDGIVLHTGNLETLKRFKDDVTEVRQGFDCGLNIDKFNDIKEGDIVEAFEMREIKKLTA